MKKRCWLAILCAILALALTVAAASADTGDDYKKMTDASGLHDGDKVIFVSDDGSNYQAMAADFSGMQVTVSNNIIAEQDGMLPLTLAETDGGWIFVADGGYLAINESALTIVPDQADAAVWSVSIASDGTAAISCADGNLIFAEQDGAYRFACGAGGNEVAIYNSTVEAEQHAFGDNLWWSFANGKLTIGGSGDMPDFSSSSDQPWASIRSEITEIEIQDGVTNIGAYAFYRFRELTSVTIPDCLTSIGFHAFSDCTELMSITIPDSVTRIGEDAFRNSGLWNTQNDGVVYFDSILLGVKGSCGQIIEIKDGTRLIADCAFGSQTQIIKVIIPDSVTIIGQCAFYKCSGIETVIIGNGVTIINNSAFASCTGLMSVTMPCSAGIGFDAFSYSLAISSVHLTVGTGTMIDYRDDNTGINQVRYTPWQVADSHTLTIQLDEGIQNIGNLAFENCAKLESIVIPDSVKSIGNYAFYNCKGLTSITIPASVTTLGGFAFSRCTGLTEITIQDSETTIGNSAFSVCTALKNVYYKGTLSDRESKLTIEAGNDSLVSATWHYELAFTTQPKSVTVANGKTATFKVVAKGGTVSYQWYYSKDNGTKWTKMSGKTSASLSVKASTTTNGYLYRCVAKNAKYTETSKSAKLTVSGVKPKIVVQPKAATVKSGKTNTFKVVAAGSGLKYQWYYSKDNGTKWTKMSGKTSASLKIKGSATTNGYLYRCTITNTKGNVTSKSVKLTVSGVKPKIVVQPTAATVKSGKTAKFTVVAAGTELKYQWYYSKNAGKTWTKMSGKTAATLSVNGSKTNNGYLYRCVVKNTKGSVTSKNAKLTVK